MSAERPEYVETLTARRRAWMFGAAALVVPTLLYTQSETTWAAPYAFTLFVALAVICIVSVEMDRLHRRIDAIRDDD
jgi:hypothetical protein